MAITPELVQQKIQEAKEKHLKKLDLSGLKLTEIPAEVFELEWLDVLIIRNNQLTEIPETITRLQNLTSLNFRDNPIEKPPPEVITKGIDAIRNYFRQLEAEGTDYLYEAKLLIVGEGGQVKQL